MSTVEFVNTAEISAELQALQKQRVWYLKTRNMIANRLQATVAGTLGYHSGMKENERKAAFVNAAKLICQTVDGTAEPECKSIILTTMIAIDAYNQAKQALEKEMLIFAKQLPVAEWVGRPEQRGFGLLFLAIVVGEAGDLSNYANPGKLWRRFGCAPYTKDGETRMGATWRSRSNGKKGTKLHAADWEDFGYSPRRRSIAYLIGEGLLKQNGAGTTTSEQDGEPISETEGVTTAPARPCGPYRQRYDETKARCKANHPDYSDLQCHRHGMLLASKLLLKNLWIEWKVKLGHVAKQGKA